MKTMLSPLRDALASPSTEATPVASVAAIAVNVEGTMNAGVLDALPRSELDALRQSPQGASTPAAPRQNELDTSFKLRDLTLPYSAFATAAKTLPSAVVVVPDGRQVGGDRFDGIGVDRDFPGIGAKGIKLPGGVVPGGDPDNNPRADYGDGDGTGRQPGIYGPKGPHGDPVGGGGDPDGGFHAFDIDDLLRYYRDPDLNPRAQDGGCGSTGCGTTDTPGCGASGCGTTSTPGCGASGCGTTNSPGMDPFSLYTRTDLLRQQLATQLAVANVKQTN